MMIMTTRQTGLVSVVALVGLIAAALAAGGCGGQPRISDEDVQKLLYPTLIEMMDKPGKHPPILVDVRSPTAFGKGHIPGAINIPLTELRADHPSFGKKNSIIVYSGDWIDSLSNAAAKKLMIQGVDKDRVFDFRGGLDYWDKQGGQIVTK